MICKQNVNEKEYTSSAKRDSHQASKFFENRINECDTIDHQRENLRNREWFTTKQAAEYLGTTPKAIINKVYRGQLPIYKPHGRLFFKRIELDRLIEGSRKGGFK